MLVSISLAERIVLSVSDKSQGGAEGRDMQTLLEKHPETAGKLVFQDQKPVIEGAEHQRERGILPMVYDFFTPQVVSGDCSPHSASFYETNVLGQGARAYFMHRILHDWYVAASCELCGD